MKLSKFFLCCLFFLACESGVSTPKSVQRSDSIKLEVENLFKIGEDRFEPFPVAEDNYQVTLQRGKTYLLTQPAAVGRWHFSVDGLALNGNLLTIDENAHTSYVLTARQSDPAYKQMQIYVKIITVEKSVFDGEIELFSGSQKLENILFDLEDNLELSQLRIELDGQELASREFDWQYRLFALHSSSRALNPAATVVSESQNGNFIIHISQLKEKSKYELEVVARPRQNISGTISKNYIFTTGAELHEYDILPILFYPPLKAGTKVAPILTGNLGNGDLHYSLENSVTGVAIDPSNGELTLASSYAGEITVNLKISAKNGYNPASTSYTGNIISTGTASLTFLPFPYYLDGNSSQASSTIRTSYVQGALYKPEFPVSWDSTAVSYSSNRAGIISIDQSSGEVTVLEPGRVTITASYGNERGVAEFTFDKLTEKLRIDYTIDEEAALPWVLTAQKIGNKESRSSSYYLNVDEDIASVDDHGTLTVKKNRAFLLTWIVEPNAHYYPSSATWGYNQEAIQSKPRFKKEESVYGGEAFEFVHLYPPDDTRIEFLFGKFLRPESLYLRLDSGKLYPKKVGEQKVTVKIFLKNQLVNEVESLLKILPKKIAVQLANRHAHTGSRSIITLPQTLKGIPLRLQATPKEGVKFYTYDSNTDQWRENNDSFLCDSGASECSFALQAAAEGSYTINVKSDDVNYLLDPVLSFSYTVSSLPNFSYNSFQLNSEQQLQAITPNWETSAPSGLNFNYQPALTGLSIDRETGVLRFDSLANLAAAGGQSVMVNASGKEVSVALKIKSADKAALQQLLSLFINDAAIGPTGNYNAIDTSQVKDMSSLFSDGVWDNGDILESFNGDISQWDTSQVEDMSTMFYGATAFNQDIGAWDTSNLKNMSWLFYIASSFNQDIGSWDTSQVTQMRSVFGGALAFNQDISAWDTSQVTNMSYMFNFAGKFNQDISAWDTSQATKMVKMFEGAGEFEQDISAWNVQAAYNNSNFTDQWGHDWDNGLVDIFALATTFNDNNSAGETTVAENYFTILQN